MPKNYRAPKDEAPQMPPKYGADEYDQESVNEAAKGNRKARKTAGERVRAKKG